MRAARIARGPWFEELTRSQAFTGAPAVTVTAGLAAAHQAIVGNRLALSLDHRLAARVTGAGPIAAPGLVWDLAIGQSTVATQNVRANLFYRGLVFSRLPRLGDTLSTVVTVEGLRQNRRREDRAPTGLVALRISTVDQEDRPVLDFWRCAMIPLGDPHVETGHSDDLDVIGSAATPEALAAPVAGWQLDQPPPGSTLTDGDVGAEWEVLGGDVVSSAPELARLTLNLASAHHDSRAGGGRRLVYGGHTIGLALSQITRALPQLLTVVGWHSCDHLGPVFEGDTLRSRIVLEQLQPVAGGGRLVHLRSSVVADGEQPRPVLNWRLVAFCP